MNSFWIRTKMGRCRARSVWRAEGGDNLIIDILNILVLIEWAALGIAVGIKAKSLYRRAGAILGSLEDDVEGHDGAATPE